MQPGFRVPAWLLLCALALLLPATSPAWATRSAMAPQQVDLSALVRDLQKHELQGGGQMQMVWWLPQEYWQVALAQASEIPQAARDSALATLADYNIVAVIQGGLTSNLQYEFANAADIRTATAFIDPGGREHSPIAEDALPAQLTAMLIFMKPVLANALGPVGENLHFLVYPGTDDQGRRLVDPLGDGYLRVRSAGRTHSFRLPLGSLLPARKDAASGDTFPGDFLYNPYTGQPLQPTLP